ncbi:MAG TPA: undecaprenyl-diphosphate phosphatase [Clostridiaceae bacterium]|nr:undecaprenyl-diphosphate phosphatase [Clostridiaceae bacterium]
MAGWWDIFRSIIYGIVEGITEWLPVSSTGHLILLEEWMPLAQSSEYFSMYLVVIQLGAIMAVVVTYWHRMWPFALQTGPVSTLEQNKPKKRIAVKSEIIVMWLKILVACIPAAVIGVFFDDHIDRLFYNPWVVAAALIIVGIIFILVENWIKGSSPSIVKMEGISWRIAFAIGLFQVISAVFPGVSRSGATIIGGLILGLSRTLAAEFTFYMAVPVMLGASFLKLLTYEGDWNLLNILVLLTGMAVAFLVSLKIIEFLMNYIRRNNFKPFGYYRIALGLLVILFFSFA